ncbi:hypothetical protein [Pseudomonas typographi]|uniref:Uncharacterized protein n=1 Tax=Pseudomonas typographi TaxID=2715964 RepID=A0ABR7Z8B0_9PSED|nr:hypothetical protein [Pseudomonas typographi]MBD1551887.1 hypothetical protein [Pseudomonas typographi]MBD1590242.1 hypothetical protein [Pseudomonas typographi]MBD1601566.1 hypothetical protein [Pseudomonas typographi]
MKMPLYFGELKDQRAVTAQVERLLMVDDRGRDIAVPQLAEPLEALTLAPATGLSNATQC